VPSCTFVLLGNTSCAVLLLLLFCCCQADGHCLYRSLEDQLEQTAAAAAAGGSSSSEQQLNYQELRELAAEYIREHRCAGSNYKGQLGCMDSMSQATGLDPLERDGQGRGGWDDACSFKRPERQQAVMSCRSCIVLPLKDMLKFVRCFEGLPTCQAVLCSWVGAGLL
jgi:hypothetical protein